MIATTIESAKNMKLLSISFDVANSTQLKTTISEVAPSHERKNELLHQYYRYLTKIETELYIKASRAGINLKHLFLVKNIGDELWYVYQFDDEGGVPASVLELILIAGDIVGRSVSFVVSERGLTLTEEMDYERMPAIVEKRIGTAVKCFVDILDDYIDFSLDRIHTVTNELERLIQTETQSKGLQEAYTELIKNLSPSLHLGVITETGKTIKHDGIRFDPIGHDVDRFFRTAKFALPGVVTIGQRLFVLLQADHTNHEVKIRYKHSLLNYQFAYYNFIERHIAKKELKGIGYSYSVYYLLIACGDGLLRLRCREPDPLKETRRLLLRHSFLKRRLLRNYVSRISQKTAFFTPNLQKWTRL